MIDTEHSRPTAKIYAFPSRAHPKDSSTRRPSAPGLPDRAHVPAIVFGSAWYHDAAIEAERAPKG